MTIKLVQFATGTVGRQAVKFVLDRPEVEYVGCYVTNPEKVGRDLGELVGRDAIGVTATDSLDEIEALDADVVLHMPLPSARADDDPQRDEDVICRLLASGKDVITVVGYVYPKAYGADVFARLGAACATGGSTLHGTGLHPGHMAELVPLVLSGTTGKVERIVITEAEHWGDYPSPQIVMEMMGMGMHPDAFDAMVQRVRPWMDGLFSEAVMMLADGMGATLERIDSSLDVECASEAFDIAAGRIEAGTVVAQRYRWEGIIGGRARIVEECVYRAAAHVVPDWGPPAGWDVRIEGWPGAHMTVGHELISRGVVATAAHAVNAVAAVHSAAPGIKTFLDLPPIGGRFG